MSIGQRILQARLECGLSQRQLASNHMTRNMLSAIEHDKAKPSLETLMYLAGVLNLPVGYFLGETGPSVEGFELLEQARTAFDSGEYRVCLERLTQIPASEVLGREIALLKLLSALNLAQEALDAGKRPYARELLTQADAAVQQCPYYAPAVSRRLAILRAETASRPEQLASFARQIDDEDGLLVRAQGALAENRHTDALRYLAACDRHSHRWYFLMGEAYFAAGSYAAAAEHYHHVEEAMGKPVHKKLQLCYAELKDFEKAYRYAIMK